MTTTTDGHKAIINTLAIEQDKRSRKRTLGSAYKAFQTECEKIDLEPIGSSQFYQKLCESQDTIRHIRCTKGSIAARNAIRVTQGNFEATHPHELLTADATGLTDTKGLSLCGKHETQLRAFNAVNTYRSSIAATRIGYGSGESTHDYVELIKKAIFPDKGAVKFGADNALNTLGSTASLLLDNSTGTNNSQFREFSRIGKFSIINTPAGAGYKNPYVEKRHELLKDQFFTRIEKSMFKKQYAKFSAKTFLTVCEIEVIWHRIVRDEDAQRQISVNGKKMTIQETVALDNANPLYHPTISNFKQLENFRIYSFSKPAIQPGTGIETDKRFYNSPELQHLKAQLLSRKMSNNIDFCVPSTNLDIGYYHDPLTGKNQSVPRMPLRRSKYRDEFDWQQFRHSKERIEEIQRLSSIPTKQIVQDAITRYENTHRKAAKTKTYRNVIDCKDLSREMIQKTYSTDLHEPVKRVVKEETNTDETLMGDEELTPANPDTKAPTTWQYEEY